jgi:hypothetical protein
MKKAEVVLIPLPAMGHKVAVVEIERQKCLYRNEMEMKKRSRE